MFDSEYEAFKAYCELYPHSATLLVDTYNVLESGVPNAIKAFKEVLLPQGITNCGIRLDSGDITYLSKKARKMLDEAGLTECKIVASNSLDEFIIRDLILQGAKIDLFGVGERLITAKSDPVFGGVYKLAAKEDQNGTIVPKIKISENAGKVTTPHFKKVYRLSEKETGKAIADLICVHDEMIDESKPLEIFRPQFHLEAENPDGFYRPGTADAGFQRWNARIRSAGYPYHQGLLPRAGGRFVGRGETVRKSPHLLCGFVPEALGYQAATLKRRETQDVDFLPPRFGAAFLRAVVKCEYIF